MHGGGGRGRSRRRINDVRARERENKKKKKNKPKKNCRKPGDALINHESAVGMMGVVDELTADDGLLYAKPLSVEAPTPLCPL